MKLYLPYIDVKRTFRAFENLITNITKYSAPNRRVYIDLLVENNTISIIFKICQIID